MTDELAVRDLPPHFEQVEKQLDNEFGVVKTLILYRHAARIEATAESVAKHGVHNLHLTEKGIKESELFGAKLSKLKLTSNKKLILHSSDIPRCADTVEATVKGYSPDVDSTKVQITKHGMLRGFFIGTALGLSWYEALKNKCTKPLQEYVSKAEKDNVDDLTIHEAADKLISFLCSLMQSQQSDELILACSHDIVLFFLVASYFTPGVLDSWNCIPQFLETIVVQENNRGDVRIIFRSMQKRYSKLEMDLIRQKYVTFDELTTERIEAQAKAMNSVHKGSA